jgi:GTPase SAR1 family protein
VTRRYVNAKVVLIGEGTVGKTSLAHRLVEDRYVIRDRTHGMNVWRLDLPLSPEATLERETLLWDLAGQEDYRLIHQLLATPGRSSVRPARTPTKSATCSRRTYTDRLSTSPASNG